MSFLWNGTKLVEMYDVVGEAVDHVSYKLKLSGSGSKLDHEAHKQTYKNSLSVRSLHRV